jgi:pyridoxal phosphate enzyme (YggS family)
MLKENLMEVFKNVENGNPLGEKVTLVGATKFVPVEVINEAIALGLKDISENRAQEFKDKYPLVTQPVNYHFIGTLQKNKVKYLIGKCCLIQSVDSLSLLDEINRQSENKGVVTNVLLEVNLGVEEQKHGFDYSELESALSYAKTLNGVKVKGLMAMLPESNDEEMLFNLSVGLRKVYDSYREIYGFEHLSLGMSNDYKIAIKAGSNMVRVGSKIFGRRY